MSHVSPETDTGALQTSQPTSLKDLLKTVDGAVVSRTLLRRSTGNITLFSFDRGQGLSEHTAPFDAFVLVLDGQVLLTIGGNKLEAKAGDAVVMPAHVPHALEATAPLKMLLVMIREPSAAAG